MGDIRKNEEKASNAAQGYEVFPSDGNCAGGMGGGATVIMTTVPIVERLIPISLVYATVYFGVADREHKDHAETLDMLNRASEDELAGLPLPKRESATRHSWRASQAILKPFIERGESCAKFGLALFYALRQLIDEGRYELRDGPFSDAMDAVLNPDGTVTEMANIDGIDRSAQKMGRKIVRELMEMGYYGKEPDNV